MLSPKLSSTEQFEFGQDVLECIQPRIHSPKL